MADGTLLRQLNEQLKLQGAAITELKDKHSEVLDILAALQGLRNDGSGGDIEAHANEDDLTKPLVNPELAAAGGKPYIRQATGGKGRLSVRQGVVSRAFKGMADLANLLPTGTMIFFYLLSPVFTNRGVCDVVFRTCTAIFLALCALSCMVLSFTDSFVDEQGIVRYVFVTFKGLWVIDGSPPPAPSRAADFKIKFIDFGHAIMSTTIFLSMAVIGQRVVGCLYPEAPSYETMLIKMVPLFVAAICCGLFIYFPTSRHGIGFPISHL